MKNFSLQIIRKGIYLINENFIVKNLSISNERAVV